MEITCTCEPGRLLIKRKKKKLETTDLYVSMSLRCAYDESAKDEFWHIICHPPNSDS